MSRGGKKRVRVEGSDQQNDGETKKMKADGETASNGHKKRTCEEGGDEQNDGETKKTKKDGKVTQEFKLDLEDKHVKSDTKHANDSEVKDKAAAQSDSKSSSGVQTEDKVKVQGEAKVESSSGAQHKDQAESPSA
ncbi:hypothetical protein B0A50_02846 [Salinomyces thailandicus]|uniref:Uncharacterized protein n=1 Tax=Salinomyces thailandicus TaxID=706561 RepID=A0A4U0U5D1_9PEZI|nr:hypothetical protein B0A50_02846 [Salinomyces thailandica]